MEGRITKINKTLFFLLFVANLLAIPENDGRVERAQIVSSLIRPGAIGAEIGVERGKFAYHVLLQKAPARLVLIDPWLYGLSHLDGEFDPEKQRERDLLYQQVVEDFSPFKNVEILRMKSHDAAALFPDEYFDYVYIDGEHSYPGVMLDLIDYYPKVKPGGLLIGDDYGWTGVAPAVQDFIKLNKEKCLFMNEFWSENLVGQYVIRKLK